MLLDIQNENIYKEEFDISNNFNKEHVKTLFYSDLVLYRVSMEYILSRSSSSRRTYTHRRFFGRVLRSCKTRGKVFGTSMYGVSTLDVHREKIKGRTFSHNSRVKRRLQKHTKISHLTITVKPIFREINLSIEGTNKNQEI
jgi:hypothetical protein